MLRLALTPRWLGWLTLALVASLACVWLGQWQWGKYEDRSARAHRIEADIPFADVVLATDDRRVEGINLHSRRRRRLRGEVHLRDPRFGGRRKP